MDLIQELFHGGGVHFELMHESKKSKTRTTASPKGQCLRAPILHAVHAWGCPSVSPGLGVGAGSWERLFQRPWAEAGLALHMAAALAKPPRAGRSPRRQHSGQAGSGDRMLCDASVCRHHSTLRLRPGTRETPSAQEARRDAMTPIPLLPDPFHKQQSLLGVLSMDALHRSQPGTRGGMGCLCRWPELLTGVRPGCPPCSSQQGPAAAGRSCWPPELGGRPWRSWRPQAPRLGWAQRTRCPLALGSPAAGSASVAVVRAAVSLGPGAGLQRQRGHPGSPTSGHDVQRRKLEL